MTKIAFHADNDVNSQAEAVNAAMIKENCDLYCFVGDGPYSGSGTGWVNQQKKHFDDKKDKMLWSRGNHDEDESESKQTQKDMEAWFPEAKGVGISDCWLSSRQVGNVYVISMDTQDLDIEFKRDQFNWVTSELVKAKQLRTEGKIDWIVVLFHKPFFTLKSSHSPYTAVRFLYKDLFRDAQVDFCVSGHNHNTQLWLPMIPSDSQANGEGQQLFTLAADNKTFDFNKDHGALYIVSGHSAHEWNAINDSGSGVKNVMHYRDSGKFGFTLLETDGKKAKVLSKDVDNATTFEYNVTREGGTTNPPTGCPDGQCKDPTTQQCRQVADGEHIENGICVKDPVDPDPTQPKCPRNYEFDPSLGHCIPLIEPSLEPDCGEGYKWNPTKKICEKDGGGGPDPEPSNPIAKLELPTKAEPKQTDVIADASASTNADTVEITETTSEGIQLVDIAGQKWRKKFNIPDKNNFSIGIQAVAKKGTKQSVVQKSIQVSTTGGPGPDPTGEIDEHGIKWLVAKGKKTIVTMSRDEAADDRWSGNVKGLFNGFESTFIGKSVGTNSSSHFAMKQFSGNHSGSGAEKNAWYDTGLRVDGTVQLQTEFPHPNNHDFDLPDANLFIKKISKGLEGNWIGLKWCVMLVKPNGTRKDGIRLRMWVDEDPLDANNKPKNNWKLVYDFIDTGQVIPADKQLVDEQDCEIRRSDSDRHDVYGDGRIIENSKKGDPGLHVRAL